VVIAIVGILAAVGIPQLTAYRVKAFNATALSDIREARTVEMVLFGDANQYYSTAGTGCAGDPICQDRVDFDGNGNYDLISAGSALETIGNATSFTAVSKHRRGDRVFCIDSDTGIIRYVSDQIGAPLGLNFSAPPSVVNQDDCVLGGFTQTL
jgi:type II secretory pathway pseudopilin PulG